LSSFARAGGPASGVLDAGIGDTLGLMEAWARAIQTRDGVGHVYRVGLTLSPDLVSALEQGYVLAPEHRRARLRAPHSPLPLPAAQVPHVPIALPRPSSPVHQLLDFLLK
jgi:hypothetical protein